MNSMEQYEENTRRLDGLLRVGAVIFLLVMLGVLSGCASVPDNDDEIALSPKQAATCEAEGGCQVWTDKAPRTLIQRAYEAGRAEQGKSL